jgi:hypothetical protein
MNIRGYRRLDSEIWLLHPSFQPTTYNNDSYNNDSYNDDRLYAENQAGYGLTVTMAKFCTS